MIRKNLNKGMTKINIVRKIKDRCDKNRDCQEITKQSYEKKSRLTRKIKPRYKKIKIAKKKLKIVIKNEGFQEKLKQSCDKNRG